MINFLYNTKSIVFNWQKLNIELFIITERQLLVFVLFWWPGEHWHTFCKFYFSNFKQEWEFKYFYSIWESCAITSLMPYNNKVCNVSIKKTFLLFLEFLMSFLVSDIRCSSEQCFRLCWDWRIGSCWAIRLYEM
jgi:hypothetical protein